MYAFDGEDFGSVHFRDIMMHTPPRRRWSKQGAAPSTVAHETHHALQFVLSSAGPKNYRYFYFENGRGMYVPEARGGLRLLRQDRTGNKVYTQDAFTNTARVRAFVPGSASRLAAMRYKIYLMDPTRSSYGVHMLFNEWNAYVAGGRVSVEIHRNGTYYANHVRKQGNQTITRRTDAIDGMVDMLYFCSAGVAALAKHEPDYLRITPSLKQLFMALTERTNKWMRAGLAIDTFRGFHAKKLYRHLQTHPDSAHLRRVLRGWLGARWTREHLGF